MNNKTLSGLPRLVIYSYLTKPELLATIRLLSNKDRERVDTSFIIREGKGRFKAKIDLLLGTSSIKKGKKAISVRAYDLIEVTVDGLLLESPYLLIAINEMLDVAQNRKT